MDNWKAQVKLKNGSGTQMQWVEQQADNSLQARLAIESKYGKVVQGPIKIGNSSSSADFYNNF